MPPSTESRPRAADGRSNLTLIFAGAAVALVPRLVDLGSKGLWMDEAYGVNLVRLPLGEMVAQLRLESTPPLHYLILKVWIALFGTGAFEVRLLSALFSVAGVALLGWCAQRYLSSRIAVIAMALLAVTPLHVYYAQEVRMYALLALLGTALLFCAFEFSRRPRRGVLAGAAALTVALLYTHTVALWLVAGVNVAVLVARRRDRSALLHWVGAQALAGMLYLPWFLVVLEQIQVQQIVLQWFVYIWESKSVLAHALDSVGGFTLGGFPPYFAIDGQLVAETGFRVAAVVLAAWGLVRNRDSACLCFAATAFCVAMVLSLGYSLVAQPVHIPGRTDHVLLPIFALLLATGFDAVRPQAAGAAVVAGWVAASLFVLVPFYADEEKDLTRDYVSDIDASPGDIVITTGKTYAEVAYYVDYWELPVTLHSFPLEAQEHPGYLNYETLMEDRARLVADADRLAAECRAAARRGNRCFVILVRPREINQIVADRLAVDLGAGVDVTRAPRRQSLLRHPVRILAFGPR